MPDEPDVCANHATLTDSEIAWLVRSAAFDGVSEAFAAIATEARCLLDDEHPGICADYVAELDGEPGMAWLLWHGDDIRSIHWLAGCVKGGCRLYRGHPGGCRDSAEKDTDDGD